MDAAAAKPAEGAAPEVDGKIPLAALQDSQKRSAMQCCADAAPIPQAAVCRTTTPISSFVTMVMWAQHELAAAVHAEFALFWPGR